MLKTEGKNWRVRSCPFQIRIEGREGHPGCELSRNLNYQGASRSSHILNWQTSWTNRFEGLVGEDELLVSEALRATLHSGGHV